MTRQSIIAVLLILVFSTVGCMNASDAGKSSVQHEPAAASGATPTSEGTSVTQRKLKRHAYVTIEVEDEEDFGEVIETTRGLTETYGGYVSSESTTSIEVMIPTEKLEEGMAKVGGTGEVSSKNISVQDVTSQYIDLEARIDNLETMRTRIKGLLDQSGNMEDMLKVEKELNRVTTELEQAKAQMRRIERDTTYARLNVRVEKQVQPGPVGWIFYGLYTGAKWLIVWD